jgi:aminoglycoside 6-adenylyltransferase
MTGYGGTITKGSAMTGTFTDDATIRNLVRWGTSMEDVRAMLLTSTRAVPGGKVDALSDYDVILVVRDLRPFVADHDWVGVFGDVLVSYWDPVEVDPATGVATSGNVVQYDGALKIDFTLWPAGMPGAIARLPRLPAELDAGYRVLLDKDGVARVLPAPSFDGYRLQRPDAATYLTLVNDFFIGVPYVAKCLVRGQVLPAKWALDYDMRYVYLLPMLVWRAACEHGWAINSGINGKALQALLPADLWAALEGTYAGLEIEQNRGALFRMIGLFRHAGREVGACLGFDYPEEFDRRVTDHARRMLVGEFGGYRED